ncbi:chlorohydrolase [Streptococcus pneumoniae]|nr:chlorohydrolase [Streptococcus pneumoniae]
MKIKEKTRKQVAGCSKHGFEVEMNEVSNHTYSKAELTVV